MSSVETVCLDVGGTKYKVAKATIENYPDTMLARLVSDTWQQINGEDREIFIDRDGHRFRYVLDYMRDQEVHLPSNISKKALLKDLEYFGFSNVRKDVISSMGATHEAAKHLIMRGKNNKELRQLADFTEIAHHCFVQYIQHQHENQGSEFLLHWPPEYQQRLQQQGLQQQRQNMMSRNDVPGFVFGDLGHHRLGNNGGFGSHQQQVIEGDELVVLQKCLTEYGLRHVSNNDSGVTVGPQED